MKARDFKKKLLETLARDEKAVAEAKERMRDASRALDIAQARADATRQLIADIDGPAKKP